MRTFDLNGMRDSWIRLWEAMCLGDTSTDNETLICSFAGQCRRDRTACLFPYLKDGSGNQTTSGLSDRTIDNKTCFEDAANATTSSAASSMII